MEKNERVRKLMDIVELNEDERDDDGEIFDLKQTILFSDLSFENQQMIKVEYYGDSYTTKEINNSLSVKQCITVYTDDNEGPKIVHRGFQLYDDTINLEKHIGHNGECQIAILWGSALTENLLNESFNEIN